MLGRARKILRSRWDYTRFVYGHSSRTVWQLVAAAVAVLGLVLPAVLPKQVFAGMNAIGLALAVAGALTGAFLTFRRWRSAEIESLEDSPPVLGVQWAEDGWSVRHAFASDNASGTRVWDFPEVDEALWRLDPAQAVEVEGKDGHATPARLDREPYHLPPGLQDVAAASLRRSGKNWTRKIRGLPVRFNGRCLGLRVEPTVQVLSGGELVFGPVRYFDGECSNELWRFQIMRDGKPQSVQPHTLAVDRAHRALRLDQSRAANIVGISMFALTRDHKVMLVQQTQGNSIAPGALASSSSGSLDLADFPQGRRKWWWWRRTGGSDEAPVNAVRVLLSGMLRELFEESLVEPGRRPDGGRDWFGGEVLGDTARVTGYWRWESRAMKPEFSGIVRVDVDSGELMKRKHSGGETAFTDSLVAVDARVLEKAAADEEVRVPRAGERNRDADGWERRAINLLRGAVLEARGEPEGDVDAVELSPSCEQAWVHAVRFVAMNREWGVSRAGTQRSK